MIGVAAVRAVQQGLPAATPNTAFGSLSCGRPTDGDHRMSARPPMRYTSLQRQLSLSFGAVQSQGREDAWPQPARAPELIALVGPLPLPVLARHRTPGAVRADHREDAAQDDAVVVARPSPWRSLRREQRRDHRPLHIGEAGRRWSWQRDHARGGRVVTRTGPGRRPMSRGDGLVCPTPPRPAQAERAPTRRFAQREHQPTHLRHGEGDQARDRAPFFARSSCRAAWRMTTR